MDKSACFRLGQFGRSKGLNGEVRFNLEVDDPSGYEDLDVLFLEEKGALVPYLIERLHLGDRGASVLKLAEVETQTDAAALSGRIAFLPLSALPTLGPAQFYYHEVIGFQIVDSVRGTIGPVSSVVEGPAQDLLIVDYQGTEVLIPIVEPLVGAIDRKNKVLHVSLPDGLIEIYTDQLKATPDDSEPDAADGDAD